MLMFEFIKPANRLAISIYGLACVLMLATAGAFWITRPHAEDRIRHEGQSEKAANSVAKTEPKMIEPDKVQPMQANINARIEAGHEAGISRETIISGNTLNPAIEANPEQQFETSPPPGKSDQVNCPHTVSPGDRDEIVAFAKCQARQRDIPDHIVLAVIEIESNFNWAAKGDAGEIGLMQVMPPTARMLGFSGSLTQLADPKTNIKLGTRYLAQGYQLAKRDLCTTVMKYRAGHGESRFSVRSVNYCKRARNILKREGHEVTGELPKPTFGFETGGSVGRRASLKTGCMRKNFTPGPQYGTCLKSGSSKSAKAAVQLRRKLFN